MPWLFLAGQRQTPYAHASAQFCTVMSSIVEQKKALRSRIRRELRLRYPSFALAEDPVIQKYILESPWYKKSHHICAYISCPSIREVGTTQIISDIFQKAVMQADKPIDLILMPGLAFDRAGRRLGRGGGYYDCFVKEYMSHAEKKGWRPPLLVGMAYSLQILNEVIPTDAKDVPIDALVSSSGILRFSDHALLN